MATADEYADWICQERRQERNAGIDIVAKASRRPNIAKPAPQMVKVMTLALTHRRHERHAKFRRVGKAFVDS